MDKNYNKKLEIKQDNKFSGKFKKGIAALLSAVLISCGWAWNGNYNSDSSNQNFTIPNTPNTTPNNDTKEYINNNPQINDIVADKDINSLYSWDDVTFTVQATDVDGDSLTYEYYLNGNPVAWDWNQITLNNLAAANYTLRVVVSDGNWGVVEQTISFEVKQPTFTLEAVSNVSDIQEIDDTVIIIEESWSIPTEVRWNIEGGGYVVLNNGYTYYNGDIMNINDRSFDGATISYYDQDGNLLYEKTLDIR